MSQPTVLNAISWRDLCPWLMLSRSIAIAISPAIVIIAFLGILLTPIGWSMAEFVLTDEDQVGTAIPADQSENWIKVRTQIKPESFWQDRFRQEDLFFGQGPFLIFEKFYTGHLQLLNPTLNIRQCVYYLFGTVWMLGLWSVLGAMICRIAATRFTRDERTGIFEAFFFVRKRIISVWISSFVPLGLILLFAIPLSIVGLMMSANFLLMLVGLGYFLVALIGLFMAIVLIPLFFGYPLLWPAISTEGSDAFEAVSRSYSYPTQKPYHYVFYWIVILVIGYLAAFVVSILATKSVEFAKWGTSWGAGTERIREIDDEKVADDLKKLREEEGTDDQTPSDSEVAEEGFSMLSAGANSIEFWERSVQILTIGFHYGFFFVAMTGMYLLLRQDNDFMELDEVYVDDDDDETLPLPQLQSTEPQLPKQLVSPEPDPISEDPVSGDSSNEESTNDSTSNTETSENDEDEQPVVEEDDDVHADNDVQADDDEQPRLENE